jgi:hypothetical protein
MPVVGGVVIGDSGAARMHFCTPELLGADDLAGGSFHERGPA